MNKSPKIAKFSWGKITVEGNKTFKDVKLFPGGCCAWNWIETGTRHFPGVQYSDVQKLLDKGAEEIIFTRGVLGRLRIKDNTIKQLESEGITFHILKTKEAVKLYNKLIESKKVGALIHTTC